jgi:molecular chaperone GrpE (heat shock protein)
LTPVSAAEQHPQVARARARLDETKSGLEKVREAAAFHEEQRRLAVSTGNVDRAIAERAVVEDLATRESVVQSVVEQARQDLDAAFERARGEIRNAAAKEYVQLARDFVEAIDALKAAAERAEDARTAARTAVQGHRSDVRRLPDLEPAPPMPLVTPLVEWARFVCEWSPSLK